MRVRAEIFESFASSGLKRSEYHYFVVIMFGAVCRRGGVAEREGVRQEVQRFEMK